MIRAVIVFIFAFLLVNSDYLTFGQIRAYATAFSHTTLGNAYMKLNQRDMALTHYVTAWELNEQYPTPEFNYIARDVAYNMGLIYWEKGLCSRAVEALRRVGPLPDGSTDIYMLNALEWLGDCYLRQNKYEQAAMVYREFMRLEPDDARGVAGMARVYAATGNLEEAERMLESVVDPTRAVYVPAYMALADVQRRLGKTDEAIKSYEAISNFVGFEKDALVALAELYQETGNIDAALQTLQRAANFFPPGDPTIRNWAARLQSLR
jgi:tetratricopeptide (TPR) repeat protein